MNVLITGVSKGLGLDITKNFLEKNYTVYGISRTKTKELDILQKQNTNLILYQFDLGLINEIKTKFKEFINFNIPIHGFVNNAAISYDDIITNIKIDPLENLFKINVISPMIITNQVIRNMIFNNISGSIVNISSISVHTGYKGLSMYAATKGAIEAFSKNVSREWGERGIRSNCVVGGFMETNMTKKLTPEQKNRIYQRTSLKKSVETTCVAETVEFLISEKSKSITGQNIFVDNGTI